ncbi:MAG: radical SAM protein, partial [Spirochaetales bacterium]|nr:radical SAM protein [Spirochaetales bacterium]
MDLKLYSSLDSGSFKCLLCPRHCVLQPGTAGFCRVRRAGSAGITAQQSPVTVIAEDPVEKKPFYHFFPGTSTLSVGFSGCNMACPFCQNHQLVETEETHKEWTPDFIAATAIERNSSSVTFTYSEPTMHIEFLMECSSLLSQAGIPAALVTNGCINRAPAENLLKMLTAVKVDLKSFNPEWYRKELQGDLETVKQFIASAYSLCHTEVVSLIIPGKNDSPDEIATSSTFLADIDKNIPFHLTAYYPQHKYSVPPTAATT